MGRKKIGDTIRRTKTVRMEDYEFLLIKEKFGSFRKMIDAVVKKIKQEREGKNEN